MALGGHPRTSGNMVKRQPRTPKLGIHSYFGPISRVEFENWDPENFGQPYCIVTFGIRSVAKFPLAEDLFWIDDSYLQVVSAVAAITTCLIPAWVTRPAWSVCLSHKPSFLPGWHPCWSRTNWRQRLGVVKNMNILFIALFHNLNVSFFYQ